mmetsp:Transcript_3429/g.12446  ORF Transcript_3429/g.12446 Transcript_3429/m.12446 type:complete len:220 (+) Transcript_3429:31-690(+)
METTNTKVVGVVMVGGASGSMRTTYTTRRRGMIMMKKQGLANDLNKRTRDIKPPPPPPTTTTRRHLALGTFIWGSVFASSSSSSLALDSECASCSDSNSSLQPGDKAFRVSNTGLRVLDVKEGKGDQASKGQVGARTCSLHVHPNVAHTDSQLLRSLPSSALIGNRPWDRWSYWIGLGTRRGTRPKGSTTRAERTTSLCSRWAPTRRRPSPPSRRPCSA